MKYKQIQSELCEKHQLLSQTDYIDNKISEALVFGSAEELNELKEKYSEIIANRKLWRKRINELERTVPEDDNEPERYY